MVDCFLSMLWFVEILMCQMVVLGRGQIRVLEVFLVGGTK